MYWIRVKLKLDWTFTLRKNRMYLLTIVLEDRGSASETLMILVPLKWLNKVMMDVLVGRFPRGSRMVKFDLLG